MSSMEKSKKKSLKKAMKGQITTFSQYEQCILSGIHAKSDILFLHDKTRINCRHDVNITELRDLLISIFIDKPPPKFFEVKNRPFIRHVVIIHLSECDDPNALQGLSPMLFSSFPILTTRVSCGSNATNQYTPLTKKLLTIDSDETDNNNTINTNSNNNTNINSNNTISTASADDQSDNIKSNSSSSNISSSSYVLSESLMRMWSYPLPIHNNNSYNTNNSSSGSDSGNHSNHQNTCTKRAMDDQNNTKDTVTTSNIDTVDTTNTTEDGNGNDIQDKKRIKITTNNTSNPSSSSSTYISVTDEVIISDNNVTISNTNTTTTLSPSATTTTTTTTSSNSTSAAADVLCGVLEGRLSSLSEASRLLAHLPRMQCVQSYDIDNNSNNDVNDNNDNNNGEVEVEGKDIIEDGNNYIEVNTTTTDNDNTTQSNISNARSSNTTSTSSSCSNGNGNGNGNGIDIKASSLSIEPGENGFIQTLSCHSEEWKLLGGGEYYNNKNDNNDYNKNVKKKNYNDEDGNSNNNTTSTNAANDDATNVDDELLPMNMVAIDCEMCDTSQGLELTRISLVNANGVVLLDTLVLPDSPITDYRTQWSGISASTMKGVNIRLLQVQLELLRIIKSDTLLIGHSLENDLKAIKILHYNCIDTAILYPHIHGYPLRRKLKDLAKEYLFINIQCSGSNTTNGSSSSSGSGSTSGHDSVEDARTALFLAKLKFERGPSFGLKSSNSNGNGNGNGYNNMDHQSPLLSILPPERVNSALVWNGADKTRLMRMCTGGTANAISCTSNEAVIKKSIQFINNNNNNNNKHGLNSSSNNIRKQSLLYLNLHYEELYKIDKSPLLSSIDNIKQALQNLEEEAIIIITNQMSLRNIDKLMKQRRVCSTSLCASTWSVEQENELKKLLVEANYGQMCFTMIHKSELK